MLWDGLMFENNMVTKIAGPKVRLDSTCLHFHKMINTGKSVERECRLEVA